MSGYIKYFDDDGKNMSFVTDDKEVYEKYNELWYVVKKLLKLKFFVNPVRDDKYIIAKLKILKNVNTTTFTNNVIPIDFEIIDDDTDDSYDRDNKNENDFITSR